MTSLPSLLVLNLTTDCNMRCLYCYASAGDKQNYMQSKIAIKTIKELKELNKNKTIRILFHGGEPLLCFKQIEEIVDFCKKNYKDGIDFYIQTNATLLTPSIIQYLSKNNIKISISIDGCNETSNYCRVLKNSQNSFHIIQDTINNLNKYQIEYNCLVVLNKHNYKYVEQIIKYFVKHNCTNFSFNYFIKSGRGKTNNNLALTNTQLFTTTKKILHTIHKFYDAGIILTERNTNFLVRTIYSSKKYFMCANSPCGAGLNLLGITPTGDIYPCDDLSSEPLFCLGNIEKSHLKDILNNKKLKYFLNCSYENIEQCKNCTLKNKCGAGCCSRKFFENGNIYTLDPICSFYKKIIPYIEDLIKNNKIPKGLYNLK